MDTGPGKALQNKACKACGVLKPLFSYPKSRQCRDGHEGTCRACKLAARDGGYRTPGQKAALRARVAKWRTANPHKKRAHRQVGLAIQHGMLQRGSCEVCGSLSTEAHHDDYDAPLAVRWLCKAHHEIEHTDGLGSFGTPQPSGPVAGPWDHPRPMRVTRDRTMSAGAGV